MSCPILKVLNVAASRQKYFTYNTEAVFRCINSIRIENNCEMFIFSTTVQLSHVCKSFICPCWAACVGVHLFLSIAKCDGCSGGIIVRCRDRGIAFPAYLASSHSYWLLGQESRLTPNEVINHERRRDSNSVRSQKCCKKNKRTHIYFHFRSTAICVSATRN